MKLLIGEQRYVLVHNDTFVNDVTICKINSGVGDTRYSPRCSKVLLSRHDFQRVVG